MYIRVYMYMYMNIHVNTYIYIHPYIYTYIYIFINLYIYLYNPRKYKTSSVGQSSELKIPRSSVQFQQKSSKNSEFTRI